VLRRGDGGDRLAHVHGRAAANRHHGGRALIACEGRGRVGLRHRRVTLYVVAHHDAKAAAPERRGRAVNQAAGAQSRVRQQHDGAAARQAGRQCAAERVQASGALDDFWNPCRVNCAHDPSGEWHAILPQIAG